MAGYTLVEMLASLIIVGLISALMLSGLNTGRRVWERADVANFAGETISGAQMLLRERLERAFPATRYDKIPTYADFAGTAEAVNFLSPPRDIHAPQALMRYTLGLASNGDLVLSSLSDLAVDPQAPGRAVGAAAQCAATRHRLFRRGTAGQGPQLARPMGSEGDFTVVNTHPRTVSARRSSRVAGTRC